MNRRLFLRLTAAIQEDLRQLRRMAPVTYTSTTAGMPEPMRDAEQPKQLDPPTIDVDYEVMP